MSGLRAAVICVMFAGIGVALVHLRAEQARAAARSLALEAEWVGLRRELWNDQSVVARLRAPDRVQRFLSDFAEDRIRKSPRHVELSTRVRKKIDPV